MKKSKQIQLVLITAVLASCNRATTGQQSVVNGVMLTDTTFISNDSTCVVPYDACWFENNPQFLNYPFSLYYYGLMNIYYYPAQNKRMVQVGHSSFIVRGGFGKSGVSASS